MPAPISARSLTAYYDALTTYQRAGVRNEGAIRHAFQTLLDAASPSGWAVLGEQTIKLADKRTIRLDGEVRDQLNIRRGIWEAKDTSDDLDTEIRAKIAAGYPLKNSIFENSQRAVLYQNGARVLDIDMRESASLSRLLEQFFGYTEPQIDDFYAAVARFRQEIPQLAQGLTEIIEREKQHNTRFRDALHRFLLLCQASLNPQTTEQQVEDMLIQHLLTERIFRSVFDNPDFVRRNAIAQELEKVIAALTSRAFSRDRFLGALDYFYRAIENAARTIDDYSEKSTFLNAVYEQFFQSYSTDTADTHGIVYTPAPIVRWMVASVEQALAREFGTHLADRGVHILDPCVGTGTFVLELMEHIGPSALAHKYAHELHCNEVLLLPYYIAAQNIEHEYWERTGQYAPFDGICFVDTLDMSRTQLSMFAPENTERIQQQEDAPIFVIIGNPPYNVGQTNENDNNKNRRYDRSGGVDQRIRETYVRSSQATLKTQLYDMYVRFFRWATDRLGDRDGMICFVSNGSFLDQIAFDGMRKELAKDFTSIYTLDLGGNVRQNPKLSGTTHNVFGIQVTVAITLLIRNRASGVGSQESGSGNRESDVGTCHSEPQRRISQSSGSRESGSREQSAAIYYARVDEWWRKEEKYAFLDQTPDYTQIEWQHLTPNARGTWLTEGMLAEFDEFVPLGSKAGKAAARGEAQAIFKLYSLGVSTNRDTWVYDFDPSKIANRIQRLIDVYDQQLYRWTRRKSQSVSVDNFVDYDNTKIKWSEYLKNALQREQIIEYSDEAIRQSLYRPFCRIQLYYDGELNDRPGLWRNILPDPKAEQENRVICLTTLGSEKPFLVFISNLITDYHFVGAGAGTQCFPFYTYDEDGSNRRENITDWALGTIGDRLQALGDGDEDASSPQPSASSLTKWDIFHYVYGLLHAPDYRTRYAANLKRDLPHIPVVAAPDFWRFVAAGRELADLHVGYERAAEYPLRHIENRSVPWTWRVEKMRLNRDRTAIIVNESLTLDGIPPQVFDYKLGNRSALEWVIDQYRVKVDKRSGIVSDPNDPDDPEAIVRLVKQVISVSLRTVEIVAGLPSLGTRD